MSGATDESVPSLSSDEFESEMLRQLFMKCDSEIRYVLVMALLLDCLFHLKMLMLDEESKCSKDDRPFPFRRLLTNNKSCGGILNPMSNINKNKLSLQNRTGQICRSHQCHSGIST